MGQVFDAWRADDGRLQQGGAIFPENGHIVLFKLIAVRGWCAGGGRRFGWVGLFGRWQIIAFTQGIEFWAGDDHDFDGVGKLGVGDAKNSPGRAHCQCLRAAIHPPGAVIIVEGEKQAQRPFQRITVQMVIEQDGEGGGERGGWWRIDGYRTGGGDTAVVAFVARLYQCPIEP